MKNQINNVCKQWTNTKDINRNYIWPLSFLHNTIQHLSLIYMKKALHNGCEHFTASVCTLFKVKVILCSLKYFQYYVLNISLNQCVYIVKPWTPTPTVRKRVCLTMVQKSIYYNWKISSFMMMKYYYYYFTYIYFSSTIFPTRKIVCTHNIYIS